MNEISVEFSLFIKHRLPLFNTEIFRYRNEKVLILFLDVPRIKINKFLQTIQHSQMWGFPGENTLNRSAEGRTRTGTQVTLRGILSPLRLPIPPPRHPITINQKIGVLLYHNVNISLSDYSIILE